MTGPRSFDLLLFDFSLLLMFKLGPSEHSSMGVVRKKPAKSLLGLMKS